MAETELRAEGREKERGLRLAASYVDRKCKRGRAGAKEIG